MPKKFGIIISIILILSAMIYYNPGSVAIPVDSLDILAGIGMDLAFDQNGQKQFLASSSSYTFPKKDEISSKVISGYGQTINETRSSRQMGSNRRFVSALEKVIIFSEDLIRNDINSDIDILFSNANLNDMGWLVVCKGKALDIIKQKVDGSPSSSDYISEMISNSKESNFYSNNYKVMDAYVRIGAEGRNMVLPYIELIGEKPRITGMALFKGNKMVEKIGADDARVMNMMRENKSRGIIEYKKDFDLFTSAYATVKNKISCSREDSKYVFTIQLNFDAEIISNTYFEDFNKSPKAIKEYEQVMAQQIKAECESFLNKMQKELKVDCLDLGRVACAKYGRKTGVDWNEIVSDSTINVKVKVNVNSLGRGRYSK
jgi:Ger(x)C family germination protein